ncbi:hypothetical protein BP6252_10802 [Coleophoma cylindrospora]|uniref:DUF6594 domain-containing protein n=1 Tax=Coleophoma cylindrospora TaxID=1849047 RepID=A0A3D8QN84_9HELO|nr:hypothetical protein BP6252_10802 [Coleophoma cylindrospora]
MDSTIGGSSREEEILVPLPGNTESSASDRDRTQPERLDSSEQEKGEDDKAVPEDTSSTAEVTTTLTGKTIFIRVLREHISATVLDKYLIPHADDPDPRFLIIPQHLPDTQLEELWKESSATVDTKESPSNITTLPPIPEVRGSSESSAHASKASEQLEPQAAVANRSTSNSPVPGPSEAVAPKETALSQTIDRQAGASIEALEQWEDIGYKKEKKVKRFSSNSSGTSMRSHERTRQLSHKIKRLAWNQAISNKATINTFDKVQLLLLLHAEHDLVLQLEKFDSRKQSSRKRLRIKMLQGYQWTQNLTKASWTEAHGHITELKTIYSEFASVYNSPYAFDSNSFASIGKKTSLDTIQELLLKALPPKIAVADPAQAEILTQLQELGLADHGQSLKRTASSSPIIWFIARFLLAISGGGLLLVPIIIMSFVQAQNIRLLVTSLFVIAFAAFLATLKRVSSSFEILGGAAAYTAILVIFLGNLA